MAGARARRRLAWLVLAGLAVAHLFVFGIYVTKTRQLAHQVLFLDARDAWGAGRLALARDDYRRFLDGYRAVTWPVVIGSHFPSEASAWFSLGRVEQELGEVDAALAAFARAMQLEPPLGRREYRDLLYESGRFEALERFARRTLAAEPRSLPATFDLGAALYALGRPAEAALAYERGLGYVGEFLARYDPSFHGRLSIQEAQLLNLAAIARLAAGEELRARAACDALAARTPPGVHLDQLCRAYLAAAAGDTAASRASLSAYVPPGPEHDALVVQLRARLGR